MLLSAQEELAVYDCGRGAKIPDLDPEIASGISYEVDPEFLEHARREQFGQPHLPWEA